MQPSTSKDNSSTRSQKKSSFQSPKYSKEPSDVTSTSFDLNDDVFMPSSNDVTAKRPSVTIENADHQPRQRTLSIMLSIDSYTNVILSRDMACSEDVNDVISIGGVRLEDAGGAPDGGWSWVVLGAVFVTYCTMGFVFAGFSVLYVELVEIFQEDRGKTGWIGSLFAFTGNILSFVFGAMIESYGCRKVAVGGALTGTVGLLLSSLLLSVSYLYFTHGLVTSIGNGMLFISSMVSLQRYFNKKRALANGIGTCGLSVGAFVAAPVLRYSLDTYGLSGTYLIIAGVWLQNLVTASLYRPLPKIEDPTLKQRSIRAKFNRTSSIIRDMASRRKSLHDEENRTFLKGLFDFTPLKDKHLVMFLIGSFLLNIGAMGFYNHYLSKMMFVGVKRHLAIALQTTLAGTMGISRVIFSFVSHYKCTNRVLLYALTVITSSAVVITFPLAKSVPMMAVYGIVHGILAGCYFCIQATVLVDLVGVERITKTTAFFNMVVSLSILIAIPLTGFLCDVSKNYDLPFYVIGCLHLIGGSVLLALVISKAWHKLGPQG